VAIATRSWDPPSIGDTQSLRDLGDIFDALDRLPVPVFAIDRDMNIRWLNAASRDLVGDRQGEKFSDVLDPASVPVANQMFAQKIVGSVPATEYEVTLRTRDGSLVKADVSSVAVQGGEHVAGVFGLVDIKDGGPRRTEVDEDLSLTPRQGQVLHLLARGCSTEQMAGELGVTEHTIRNHVRAILHRLGVHSRLEAVIEAHERNLV
jgi:DNA-binding CsgD family transcriptional regulator